MSSVSVGSQGGRRESIAARRRLGRKRRTRRALAYGALTLLAVVSLVPFLWGLSTSLKSIDEIFLFPPKWLPSELRFDNYTTLWRDFPMNMWLWNSIKVSFFGVFGSLVFCSMSAYAFARLRFPGRDILFYLFLSTMMIPGAVTMIPSFVLMRYLGWIDTHYALIIPGLASAFGTFLLRQFFLTIPRELEDAARIDGARHWQIYLRIILPLSGPALATLGVFTFMGVWNDFIWPLIVINTPELMTLPVGLGFVNDVRNTDWARLMAGDMIMLAPTVVLFISAQRYFVRGITFTGMKG
jgi:multiple sugar transport system permease protein